MSIYLIKEMEQERKEDYMEHFTILLNSFDKIKEYIKIVGKLDCDLDMISGRYIIDGKSILGIFSLDLSKPIEVSVVNGQQDSNYVYNELKSFII